MATGSTPPHRNGLAYTLSLIDFIGSNPLLKPLADKLRRLLDDPLLCEVMDKAPVPGFAPHEESATTH